MHVVDLAMQNGVNLDGTPIPEKCQIYTTELWMRRIKDKGLVLKKSMRNRCVKTGFKHFDKETLNQLLID